MTGAGLKQYAVMTLLVFLVQGSVCLAEGVKQPDVAGQFYPADQGVLSSMIYAFLAKAQPQQVPGAIFVLIVPHAGYTFSGQTAAQAYKLIAHKPYTTVVVMAAAHQSSFEGIAVAGHNAFRTALGDVPVDTGFVSSLIGRGADVFSDSSAFFKEHPIEVQIPFIQKTLPGAKIVPVVFGQVRLDTCTAFAALLQQAIGSRSDVLVIASSDMYHGYDFRQAEAIDLQTLEYLRAMDAPALFRAHGEGKAQLCGGPAVVTAILAAQEIGQAKLTVLSYTNSAEVTGQKKTGEWTVGYGSSVITIEGAAQQTKGEAAMLLTQGQRNKLLAIARSSIETYLKTNKKLKVEESEPVLSQKMGAFVTLRGKSKGKGEGELRGCIGNMVGTQPLFLTVRDMAVEAAVGDPRFSPMSLDELKDVEIEISVLSPLEKVASADAIVLGKHGVLVKRGFNSGVFLPQVATETGWSKEEFLSQLCSQKAGLRPDAWKDPATELYIFSAEVFSE